MRTIKIILATAVMAFGMVGASAAVAAPPDKGGSSTVITLDPRGAESLPLAETAADWSKNTDVSVVVAPCTGANCIHFAIVDNPCPNGQIGFGYTGGCAYASSDPGACQLDIADDGPVLDPNMRLYITKHEVGHCIYWFGGAGFIHLDCNRCLMKDGLSGYPRASETRLTSEDRSFARSLF